MYFSSLFLRRKYVLIVNNFSVRNLNYLSESYNKNIISLRKRLDNVALPERFKGTIVEKWSLYWKELYRDYYEVAKDSVNHSKSNPRKSALYLACFGFLLYCNKTNPSETSFRDAILSANNEVLLVNKSIRNPFSDNHLTFIESCYNEGLIRFFSFGIFSVVWIDDYDNAVGLYKAKCPYLEPQYLTMYQRVVDVGFLNKWWFINKKMKDYDINPTEWQIIN